MADAASCLTHLSVRLVVPHFNFTFNQKKLWSMIPLPSVCKRRLTSMLYNKRSLQDFYPKSSKNTPPHGASGASSSVGCRSNLIYKSSPITYLSSRSLPIARVLVIWKQEGGSSRRGLWNSNFGRSDKYLQLWGTTTPVTTR